MENLKPIKIATLGVAHDFYQSLFPAVVRNLGYEPIWTIEAECDLVVMGPFWNKKKVVNWVPKPLRPLFENLHLNRNSNPSTNPNKPILFITGENVRHDFYYSDYSITFDLGISKINHFRMPYWMEMIDWSKEGITGNLNPRYGRLLSIERLMQPLGNEFLSRPQKTIIFASHLREPRATLINAVQRHTEVIGYGKSFDQNIRDHHQSNIIKYDELQKVAFNLCPENSMYPGYYTEKIPEAFMAGCLPITWTDENVKVDFNPNAFINLAPMSFNHFTGLQEIFTSPKILSTYAEQALILERPSIEPLKNFIKGIFSQVLS